MATFTEAPSSATSKIKTPNGFVWLYTLRDESGKSLMDKIAVAEKEAMARGWRPAETTNGNAPAANGNAPTCPTHGTLMKESKHGGWFCPKKIADDDGTGKPVYCKQKVK